MELPMGLRAAAFHAGLRRGCGTIRLHRTPFPLPRPGLFTQCRGTFSHYTTCMGRNQKKAARCFCLRCFLMGRARYARRAILARTKAARESIFLLDSLFSFAKLTPHALGRRLAL